MNVTLIGDDSRPVIAVVGTWDPFSPECERLLTRLLEAARDDGIGAAAVMLDPPPKVHLQGEHMFPLFHNSARRIDLIRRSGVDLVVRIDFARDDLYRTAADFFDTICPRLVLQEFWLRHGQDLGRNVGGSELAVSLACRRRGIRYRLLAKDSAAVSANVARAWLTTGYVHAASKAAGCRPSFCRPAGGILRVAWAVGRYELVDPGDHSTKRHAVELIPGTDNMACLAWPTDAGDVLEVGAGPVLTEAEAEYMRQADGAAATSAQLASRTSTLIQELFHASGAPHK